MKCNIDKIIIIIYKSKYKININNYKSKFKINKIINPYIIIDFTEKYILFH